MILGRHEALKRLRESEDRFRAFVTASSDVVYQMSPDWSQMRSLRGRDFIADTDDESGGWLDRYIHPNDHALVVAAINQAIATKTVFELEHRVIRLDGSLGWVHSRAIPICNKAGDIIEWFGAARDITGRKQAEQTQQTLMSELDHRVRNTLAAVQAIAQQTLRWTKSPEQFVDSFSGRIQAMARVHALLTSSKWRGAELATVVRDQLLQTDDDARVVARGSAVRLDPQSTLHVALMLHEMATNSLKHGALSVSGGAVSVHWSVRDDRPFLGWREEGGPPVQTPVSRGFGTSLIERTAKGQGGGAKMAVEASVLTWDIELPLKALEDAEARSASGLELPAPPVTQADNLLSQSILLNGRRLLVVEDEPLIALDIVDVLQRAGVEVVGPVGTVQDALRVVETIKFDGALLDANLGGETVEDVAAALARRKLPFVFVSGYGRDALPRGFGTVALVPKPFARELLLENAAAMLRKPNGAAPLRAGADG